MGWFERIFRRKYLDDNLADEVQEHIEERTEFDPFSFAAVPLILGAAAALASYLPTARAAAVNPVDALKAE